MAPGPIWSMINLIEGTVDFSLDVIEEYLRKQKSYSEIKSKLNTGLKLFLKKVYPVGNEILVKK